MLRTRAIGAATLMAGIALSGAPPAQAAEVPVGSASRPQSLQFDDVPGLRLGSTARRAGTESGAVVVETRPGRCQGTANVTATLLRTPPPRAGRRLGRRRVGLRGGFRTRRSLTLAARQLDTGGVDPTSAIVLTGRLPADVAPAEPRRTVAAQVVLTSETEGCLRAVRRAARRVVPTLYLRQLSGAPARVAPAHSPTRRIDGGAPGRIGGPLSGAGLGTEIEPLGDLDGDGRDDVLLQERENGDHGIPRRGLVRFGGAPGLIDSAAFGTAGFAVAGTPEPSVYGSTFAPAGNFLAGPTPGLAIAIEGRRTLRPPRGRDVAAVVIPGRRYRGFLDPRRPPAGSARVTVPRGCGGGQPRVEDVGDVNGDGYDDLYLAWVDECEPTVAGVVFGGRPGTVALDAPGARGLRIEPREVNESALVRAGDVNGDGLGDMALVGDGLFDRGTDALVLVPGRRGSGTLSPRSGAGHVRITRRGCDDLVGVTPAGDLDGDGAEELAIGIDDCDERRLRPDVAHVLRGSRSLPGRLRLGTATGTTIGARFGPLSRPAVAAGRDVSGGPGADVALGFADAGPDREGEAWVLRDVRLGERLTLGALGDRALRLLGARDGADLGAAVALTGDQTGDGRADLLAGAPRDDFAGRAEAGSVYTYAAGSVPGPPCRVARAGAGRVPGTDLGDVLTGSPGRDRLVGFQGGDCLRGLGGPDTLIGDPGPDRLEGGAGADRLLGGPGPDTLDGGAGDDLLIGGARGDRMRGGAGADRIDARDGAGDRVDAGPGDDFVRSSDRGADVVDCGPGRDTAVADPGDRLRGCERVIRRRPPVYDD